MNSYSDDDPMCALYDLTPNIEPALLGHSSNALMEARDRDLVYMNIKYARGNRDTYRAFAMVFMEHGMTLILREAASAHPHLVGPQNWPSWLPGWRLASSNCGVQYNVLPCGVSSLKLFTGNISGNRLGLRTWRTRPRHLSPGLPSLDRSQRHFYLDSIRRYC
jgi:hypothetical protein